MIGISFIELRIYFPTERLRSKVIVKRAGHGRSARKEEEAQAGSRSRGKFSTSPKRRRWIVSRCRSYPSSCATRSKAIDQKLMKPLAPPSERQLIRRPKTRESWIMAPVRMVERESKATNGGFP